MTLADQVVARLLESDPSEGRVVIFGAFMPPSGLPCHSLKQAVQALQRTRQLGTQNPEAELFQKYGVLSAVGDDVRLQGRDRLHLKHADMDEALAWLGVDQDIDVITVVDANGNHEVSAKKALLADSELAADDRREREQASAFQKLHGNQPPVNPEAQTDPENPQPAQPAAVRRRRGFSRSRQPTFNVTPADQAEFDKGVRPGALASGPSAEIGATKIEFSPEFGGVVIQRLAYGGPLDLAGAKDGDCILSVDGVGINSTADLRRAKRTLVVGKPVRVVFMRQGKHYANMIVPAQPGDNEADAN